MLVVTVFTHHFSYRLSRLPAFFAAHVASMCAATSSPESGRVFSACHPPKRVVESSITAFHYHHLNRN
jgi:hypothetical protein